MPRFFVHTAKAIKRGEPADRVFLCVGTASGLQLAWKCTLSVVGRVHPAFDRVLAYSNADMERGATPESANGSKPTAMFKIDSMYREVDIDCLAAARYKLKSLPT